MNDIETNKYLGELKAKSEKCLSFNSYTTEFNSHLDSSNKAEESIDMEPNALNTAALSAPENSVLPSLESSKNSIKNYLSTPQVSYTSEIYMEENSSQDQGILGDAGSTQESELYNSNYPESVNNDMSILSINEDKLNTFGSTGSHSKDITIDNSDTTFTHSKQPSSSISEKRVRIEVTPLCIEVDADQSSKTIIVESRHDSSRCDHINILAREQTVEKEHPDRLFQSEYSINSDRMETSSAPSQITYRRKSGAGRNILLKWIPQDGNLKLELSRGELIRKYQLHVFVFLIFLVTVISVSLSWHYRNLATQMLHASQAIFFNPRSRLLTLTGSGASRSINGHVGLDMPSWQLPLHCPIVMGNNPHDKECVWKNNAILRLKQFSGAGRSPVECYKVSWESLHPQHVPHDCFDVSDDLWYGPSNQSESLYPIRGKFFFSPSNYTVSNNGIFSSVVDFYWLSARGVGLRVNADDPVQVFWNETGDNRLCILSNYTGPFYHQINHETAPHLNYTLCTGSDTLSTHIFMSSLLEPQQKQQAPPPVSSLSGTYFSLKGYLRQTEVNQSNVIQMAQRLQETGFESTRLTLDGEWQAVHGDLKFDPERFPNASEMFEDLSALNCQLTLCVSPYFGFSSKNFERGVAEGHFVQDAGGRVTGLADSEFGLAAVADVTVPHSRAWLASKLRAIHPDNYTASDSGGLSKNGLDAIKVHSFRLTYGRQEWLPYKPHFRLGDNATPNKYRRQMTETFSALSTPLIVEHTSDSRTVPSLIPVQAKLTRLGDNRQCLTTEVIGTAFTLGLLGYPYVMVDGVAAENGIDLQPDDLSQELYIRWLELATLFPAHQHPVTPWQFKDANLTVAMAANLSRQNEVLKMAALKAVTLLKEVSKGLPIVRPLWWNDSKNQTAHAMEVKDQFLVGRDLLVAPVLCEGVTSRDIHMPPGVWQDYHSPASYVIGPLTIRDHPTPLGRTAVFKKVIDTKDMAGGTKHDNSL